MNENDYELYLRRMEQRDRQRTSMLGVWMFLVLGGPSLVVLIVFGLLGAGIWAVTPAETTLPCADRLAKAQWNAGGSRGARLICNSEGVIVERPAVTLDNGRFTEH